MVHTPLISIIPRLQSLAGLSSEREWRAHAPQPSPGPSVLIVDDNRDGAESLAAVLNLLGHEVRVAFHPDEALELIHSFEPDAMLLDIGLPEMDGYKLARKLCGILRRRPLLVAITGYGNLDGRSQAEGFDHHFLKPVDSCELDSAVRAAASYHSAGPARTALARSS